MTTFFVRVSGPHVASAAFAASTLLILGVYAAWSPFANGVESPVRPNAFLLWGFASLSAIGACSLLRDWRPGAYLAAAVTVAWLVLALTGGLYLAWILRSKEPTRGFTPEFLWLNVMLPTAVLATLSGSALWRIAKLLRAGEGASRARRG